MWDYTDKVKAYFFEPKNAGVLADANAVGEVGSLTCGDALKLMLKVDPATEVIQDARFQTFGCGSAIASSSALTELVIGRTLDDAARLTNQDIAAFLGGLPAQKMHCSVMGAEALHAAIAHYRGVAIDDDHDEGALICKCFAVDEPMLRRAVRTNRLTSMEQVTFYTKAGGSCGACNERMEEVLAAVNAEMVAEGLLGAAEAFAGAPARPALKPAGALVSLSPPVKAVPTAPPAKPAPPALAPAPVTPGPKLTLVQRIRLIEEAIAEARPTFLADGGDCELVDVDGRHVHVRLTGACAGCRMARMTVDGLAARVTEKLGAPVIVIPV
ncbi:Fe-S cluster assembly protein NifU [Rhodospirillum centenum]|uniref:Nitrogen fixation protein NifU n=1 Tax=Rhodospirillum centenum (strain ATCC 51521 / SW) TaxID=414684 RepID=B6IR30_RHOCS|nr:Fe-S cluster assembly protein NifU [Rhodospirillum centenum]ACI97916.1 Fe-S cluster assembly protein NifU [Rhodospirillum centenum SW]